MFVSFMTLVGSVILLGLSMFSFSRKETEEIVDVED